MASKARFFTKNKQTLTPLQKVQTRQKKSLGNKSGKAREIKPQLVSKTKTKQELPTISQSITELPEKIITGGFTWKKGFFLMIALVVLGFTIWQGILLLQKAIVLTKIISQRQSLMRDQRLWESIVKNYPSYRDAYFQLAVISYRLKDEEKESVYLNKTLQLDANYVPAQNLKRLSR